MADQKKHIADLPPVTLPMTGNELIPVQQGNAVKVMKPGDFPAVVGGFVKIDGSTPITGNQSMSNNNITDLKASVNPKDAVNRNELLVRTSLKVVEW